MGTTRKLTKKEKWASFFLKLIPGRKRALELDSYEKANRAAKRKHVAQSLFALTSSARRKPKKNNKINREIAEKTRRDQRRKESKCRKANHKKIVRRSSKR